jgi:hypothetical protein
MTYTSLEFSGQTSTNPAACVSVANNGSLAFGTGDFTVEMYVYRKNTVDTDGNGDLRLFQMGNWPSGKLGLVWTAIPKSLTTVDFYYFDANANGNSIVSNFSGITNTWVHIALCRASGITRTFIDGVQIGSNISDTSNYTDTTTALLIGAEAAGGTNTRFEGYMTGIRISNNARYTANFDKPLSYNQDSNTLLILNGSSSNPYGSLSSGVTLNSMTTNSSIPSGWTEVPDVLSYTNSQYIATNGLVYTLDSPSAGQATVQTYDNSSGSTITIPSNVSFDGTTYTVVSVGNSAFQDKSVTSVTLPETLVTIGDIAFLSSQLASIHIPASVTSMGSAPFRASTLSAITVDASNTHFAVKDDILYELFTGDNTAIVRSATNVSGSSVYINTVTKNGVTYNVTGTYPNGATLMFLNKTHVIIGDNVTSIAEDAFIEAYGVNKVSFGFGITAINCRFNQGCNLQQVVIGGNVTSIGSSVFANTSLTNVIIPSKVTTIGSGAFSGYTGSVFFHGDYHATLFSNNAFSGANTAYYLSYKSGWASVPTGFTSMALLNELTTRDNGQKYDPQNVNYSVYGSTADMDWNNNLSELPHHLLLPTYFIFDDISYNLTSFGNQLQTNYTVYSLTVDEGIRNASVVAFNVSYNLTFVSLPSTMSSMGPIDFPNIPLKSMVFPNGNNNFKIYNNGLYNISTSPYSFKYVIDKTVTSINIASDVSGVTITKIDQSAFDSCTSLSDVFIGASINLFGDQVFKTSLSYTFETGSALSIINGIVFNTSTGVLHKSLSGSGNVILSTVGNNVSITSIVDSAFENSTTLTGIFIPNSVTVIGYGALSNCTNLTSVTFGDNSLLTNIGQGFCMYSKISHIVIPNSVRTIGWLCFMNINELESITFPTNSYFTELPPSTCGSCTQLKLVVIPANITSIGSSVFHSCSSLSAVYFLGNKPSNISDGAFGNISSSAILYYPAGNTTWDNYTNTNFSSIQSFDLFNPSTTYQPGDSVAILNETTIASVPSGVTMNIEADVTITSAISGSMLHIGTGKTATISSGTTTVSGLGNLILNANNTNATTVQIGTTTFTGDITVSGDSTNIVKYTGNSTLTLSGNIVKDGTTLTLDASNGSIEVSGVISGVTAGSSDIIISGDVTFSNPENPYDGPTTIHSGATLTLNESSIPNSDVTIENGGTLIIINSTMPSSVNVKSITMSTGAILDVTDGYLKVDTLNITGGTIKTYAAGSTTILCSNAATVSNTIQVDLYGSVSTGTSYFVINAASGLSGATYNVTYYGDTQNVDLNAISSSMLLYLQVAELQGFLFPAYLNLSNPITTATTYIEVTDCAGLHLGTGDFEIEWTQYQYWYDNPGNMRVFSINSWPTAVISVSIEYYQGSPRFFYWNNQGTSFNNIAAIDPTDLINQWNTFKVNRTSGVTKFYRNGVQIGSNLTDTQNITGSASLIIGGDGNRSCPFTGWISSFRWTKGSPATNTFTINDSQESGDMSGNIYYHTPSGTTQSYIPLTLQTPYPSCFNEGTMILCEVDGEEKYMPIEKLTRGDKVVSYLHGALSILAIGKGSMVNDPSEPKRCMYKLSKTGNMTDDLMITGGHALLVDERPKGLCFKIDDKFLSFAENDKRCVKMENAERYTYYNLCLENNGNKDQRYGVYANGMLCETPSEKQFNDHQYSELL